MTPFSLLKNPVFRIFRFVPQNRTQNRFWRLKTIFKASKALSNVKIHFQSSKSLSKPKISFKSLLERKFSFQMLFSSSRQKNSSQAIAWEVFLHFRYQISVRYVADQFKCQLSQLFVRWNQFHAHIVPDLITFARSRPYQRKFSLYDPIIIVF